MIDLLQPFQFPFMQNAFLIALIVAPPCALLSCFLVLKGWALMGDAVSHAVLPGIVLAYMAGVPLLVGAFVAGLGSALVTGWLADNSRIKRDTVMGVVFSAMFAGGIVLHTAFPTDVHLDHILFGNMLGVGAADLWTAALIALPVTLILAIGLLIAPGAIAFLLTRSFGAMLLTATLVCVVAMIGGIWISFFLDSAPGPTIILILTALFLLAFLRRVLVGATRSP